MLNMMFFCNTGIVRCKCSYSKGLKRFKAGRRARRVEYFQHEREVLQNSALFVTVFFELQATSQHRLPAFAVKTEANCRWLVRRLL